MDNKTWYCVGRTGVITTINVVSYTDKTVTFTIDGSARRRRGSRQISFRDNYFPTLAEAKSHAMRLLESRIRHLTSELNICNTKLAEISAME